MDSYTITITPDDDSGNSTTLTVDTSTGQARITSVHMQTPTGLTGAQMPSVDVELLLQAVAPPTHTPAAITAPSTPEAAAPATTDAGAPTTSTRVTPPAATGDTTPPATTPTPARPRRARRGSAAGARAAAGAKASSSSEPRRRTQPTAKVAAPRKTARKQATATTVAAAGAGRVYRRMPDDFAAVYEQTGSASAIAEHYGVPRYTAQGWIGRHKKQDAAAQN